MNVIFVILLGLGIFLNVKPVIADQYPRNIEEAYQALASDAETLINQGNFNQGIELYIKSLKTINHGRIHLRLGQLYQKRAENASNQMQYQEDFALSFYHYQKCIQDQKVDELDRQLLCQTPFDTMSHPLFITGKYKSLFLDKPIVLRQEFISGSKLPKGDAEFRVVDEDTQIEYLVKVKIPAPKDVYHLPGPPNILPTQPLISNDFITPDSEAFKTPIAQVDHHRTPRIVGATLGAIGLFGLIATTALYAHEQQQAKYNLPQIAFLQYPFAFPGLWATSGILTLVGTGMVIVYF
jgi:hypothetical protein